MRIRRWIDAILKASRERHMKPWVYAASISVVLLSSYLAWPSVRWWAICSVLRDANLLDSPGDWVELVNRVPAFVGPLAERVNLSDPKLQGVALAILRQYAPATVREALPEAERRAVLRLMEKATPALLERFRSPNVAVRTEAAYILQSVDSRSASDAMFAGLADTSGKVRFVCACSVGRRIAHGVLDYESRDVCAHRLLPLLGDAEARVRGAAADALCALGRADVALPVLKQVADKAAEGTYFRQAYDHWRRALSRANGAMER